MKYFLSRKQLSSMVWASEYYNSVTINHGLNCRSEISSCLSACMLSQIRLTVTPRTVARQDPLSIGFCRQEIVEWVAVPYSRGSSRPKDRTCIACVSCTNTQILYHCDDCVCLLLLLLSRFSRVWCCATPSTAAHQAPLSLGFCLHTY